MVEIVGNDTVYDEVHGIVEGIFLYYFVNFVATLDRTLCRLRFVEQLTRCEEPDLVTQSENSGTNAVGRSGLSLIKPPMSQLHHGIPRHIQKLFLGLVAKFVQVSRHRRRRARRASLLNSGANAHALRRL